MSRGRYTAANGNILRAGTVLSPDEVALALNELLARLEAAERVAEAAEDWETVYRAWVKSPLERDMEKNGENMKLSLLMDALAAYRAAHVPEEAA